jgi:hypothetical protein
MLVNVATTTMAATATPGSATGLRWGAMNHDLPSTIGLVEAAGV